MWSVEVSRPKARFTNSLYQWKPSFDFKKPLSGFTEGIQWKNRAEKAWIVIFVADLIVYAFVGVTLSTFMGGEDLNESCNVTY